MRCAALPPASFALSNAKSNMTHTQWSRTCAHSVRPKTTPTHKTPHTATAHLIGMLPVMFSLPAGFYLSIVSDGQRRDVQTECVCVGACVDSGGGGGILVACSRLDRGSCVAAHTYVAMFARADMPVMRLFGSRLWVSCTRAHSWRRWCWTGLAGWMARHGSSWVREHAASPEWLQCARACFIGHSENMRPLSRCHWYWCAQFPASPATHACLVDAYLYGPCWW